MDDGGSEGSGGGGGAVWESGLRWGGGGLVSTRQFHPAYSSPVEGKTGAVLDGTVGWRPFWTKKVRPAFPKKLFDLAKCDSRIYGCVAAMRGVWRCVVGLELDARRGEVVCGDACEVDIQATLGATVLSGYLVQDSRHRPVGSVLPMGHRG